MKYFYAILLFISCSFSIEAQQNIENTAPPRCFTDEYLRAKRESDPSFKTREAIQNILIHQQARPANDRSVLTIPIVIHVIYLPGQDQYQYYNQIFEGIEHLNAAFSNSGQYYDPLGVNTNIQFCLATTGPSGELTYGSAITYTESELSNVTIETQDADLKNLVRWDPNRYLNIWLVNEITSASVGSGVAGYSSFPTSQGLSDDGIVNEISLFGSSIDNSKVHIHEVGHYLGLYHTFEGGCTNGNCQTDGDQVCDTPPDNSTAAIFCNIATNSCDSDDDDLNVNNPFRPVANGGLGDRPDMFSNYMDYGYQLCQFQFTSGQSDRMNAALTTTRSILLQSTACASPCMQNPIYLVMTALNNSFVNGMTGGFGVQENSYATSFEWTVNDTLMSSTDQLIYLFNTPGVYTIKVTAFNGDPNCTTSKSQVYIVGCSAQATFQLSEGPYNPGDNVQANSLASNTLSYAWYLDGSLVGTSSSWNQTFNTVGGHSLYLVTSNELCSDTSNTSFFQVGNCDLSGATKNWVFVRNSMRFENDTVVFTPQNSPIVDSYTEVTSSISDADGNLLLFSDGQRVWDRYHTQMPNGIGLMGNSSSSQCVLIVPHPGNPNQFYIFTNDDYEHNLANGLRYSIVDLTLNGGLGDVIPATKNTLLLLGGSEKLAATWHANGHDIWIGTCLYSSNSYLAYLIDQDGLHIDPVVSVIGTTNRPDMGLVPCLGNMRFSHDGNRMATYVVADKIVIADFNNESGVFSNALELPLNFSGSDQPFGIEFSPDNSKLYVGQWQGGQLRQFDLGFTTETEIFYSAYVVDGSQYGIYGHLVLGPDGRIYVYQNGSYQIDYIAQPNEYGAACNFQQSNFSVDFYINNPGSSLPNMLSGYLNAHNPSIAGPKNICKGGSSYLYGITLASAEDSTVWTHTGPGVFIAQNGSTQATLTSSVNTGTDVLMVTVYGRCGITHDTLIVNTNSPEPFSIPATANLCDTLTLFAGEGFLSYEWNNISNADTLNVTSIGTYWVKVKGVSGCYMTDTTQVIDYPATPPLSLGFDKFICNQQIVVLTTNNVYETYLWSDGSTNSSLTAYLPGIYWVKVSNGCNLDFRTDTIQIYVTESTEDINLNYNGSDLVCSSSLPFVLNGPAGYLTYEWSTGETTPNINLNVVGQYSVSVTDNKGCILRDTLLVEVCTGLGDNQKSGIQVFPNPVSERLLVTSVSKIDAGPIRLFSYSGALVYAGYWNGKQIEIPVTDFADGLYLLQAEGEHIKVLIQH
jgi:hypothetical protein